MQNWRLTSAGKNVTVWARRFLSVLAREQLAKIYVYRALASSRTLTKSLEKWAIWSALKLQWFPKVGTEIAVVSMEVGTEIAVGIE